MKVRYLCYLFALFYFVINTFFNCPQLIAVEEKVPYVLAFTPTITIKNPIDGSTIPANDIVVNGTAFDKDGDIERVEVFAHRYPFDGIYAYEPANPISQNSTQGIPHQNVDGVDGVESRILDVDGVDGVESGVTGGRQNWSQWSIPLNFDKSGLYRISSQVVDENQNSNWSQVIIQIPFNSPNTAINKDHPKIALVNPVFTETAYAPFEFYYFYGKHYDTPPGENVSSDLSSLTAQLHGIIHPYPNATYDGAEDLKEFLQIGADNEHIVKLANHIKKDLLPNSSVTMIKDQDVHRGNIFIDMGKKETNAYDLLILSHEEYVTKEMYYNFKKFVENGGTIFLLSANFFYSEVDYDDVNNTITLVEGHDWVYDGKNARKGPSERWFNENKEFFGSNYLISEIKDNITYSNNPFNYTHFEENFVNSPGANIILDYKANIPKQSPYSGATVATYELKHNKGKVIVIGLYGQHLIDNQDFVDFIDGLILSNTK